MHKISLQTANHKVYLIENSIRKEWSTAVNCGTFCGDLAAIIYVTFASYPHGYAGAKRKKRKRLHLRSQIVVDSSDTLTGTRPAQHGKTI